MTSRTGQIEVPAALRPAVGSWRSWLRFLLGFAVLYGALTVFAVTDPTWRRLVGLAAAVLLTAVIVERVAYPTPIGRALRRCGLGRPRGGRSLAAAGGVSILVLGVYPLHAAVTGSALALRPDWPWMLLGVFAFHGIAEELVWRGYAFRQAARGSLVRIGGLVDHAAGRRHARADRGHPRPGGRNRGDGSSRR